jgi:hypothetical protein
MARPAGSEQAVARGDRLDYHVTTAQIGYQGRARHDPEGNLSELGRGHPAPHSTRC